jgi:hypothetical protein
MEYVAVALIALGVLTVAVVAVLWRREPPASGSRPRAESGPRPEPPPEPESEPGAPVLRVVALGLEGAGKTVLLASQFHTLSETAPDRRYFLDADWEQENYLARMYASVSDTSAPWPKATRIGNLEDIVFTCRAHDRMGAERALFQISYLDYAGELLESGSLERPDGPPRARASEQGAVRQLKARVESAHALLLILDGRRMLQLLRSEHEGHDYFDRRLAPLLAVARRAACPVQLILTKWDLVRSFSDASDEELLRQVKARLMSFGRMQLLVQAHLHREEGVRLIPVSAVGPRFAVPDAEGRMIKRSDGKVEPLHVDVPLCAVLPDVLEHLERTLDASIRSGIEHEIRRHTLADAPAIAHSVLTSPAGKVLQRTLSGVVGDQIVTLLVDLLVRDTLPDAAPPDDGRGGSDEEEARRLRAEVLGDMRRIVGRLEMHLPSSIVSLR